MFIGRKVNAIMEKSKKDYVVKGFLKQVDEAYALCGKVLQEKLPLTNLLLRALGAFHLDARGHAVTLNYMQKLPTLATTVLNEEEREAYDKEIRKYNIDESLPEFEDNSRIDRWWGKDEVIKTYPTLCKLIQALLSCFHGPQVESSFNVMNDVIDNKSGRLNIKTFSAIQTIKYHLKAEEKTAIQYFEIKDYLHEAVDRDLCRNMIHSKQEYSKDLEKQREEKCAQKRKLIISDGQVNSKRKAKEILVNAAKKAKTAHVRKLIKQC